jgi:protein-S-isoprenylcysteine O-methyltransferase Ste14
MGFALPLLVVILLNIFLPGAVSWAKFNLPLGFQIIGLILAIACIPVILWVFNSIGKNISETVLTKESHELVTSGPYSFVRHPLYGAALLLLFSISLVFRDWIILVYSLVGLVAFRMLVIPAEEKQLLDTFGEEYERYRNRTRSLFPWIW